MQVKEGGSRGSASEASVTQAWPKLEADYLKSRIIKGDGKWDTTDLNGPETVAYLQEVAKNHKTEADECLKHDFKLWLQGAHPLYNDANRPYAGDAKRIHVYNNGQDDVGKEMTRWRSTPWGRDQLTHLPGVRDFLRDEFERGKNEEMRMNLLAEHGPQDLMQAWQYFKHWVAERPLDEAQCINLNIETEEDYNKLPLGPGENKAKIGQPGAWHMKYNSTPPPEPIPRAPPAPLSSAATVAATAAATATAPALAVPASIAAAMQLDRSQPLPNVFAMPADPATPSNPLPPDPSDFSDSATDVGYESAQELQEPTQEDYRQEYLRLRQNFRQG